MIAKSRTRYLSLLVSAVVAMMWMSIGMAQSQPASASGAATIKTGSDVIAMPGIGRVLGGFILTVGLAVAATYLFKRYLPRFTQRLSMNSAGVVTARSVVQNGVRYHIVKIDEQTILVAEGRSGIAMTVLPRKPSDTNV